MKITKKELKKVLGEKTGCVIQHTGWCCGTCFFAIDDSLTNSDWQALLYFRGQDKKEDLNNLPDDKNKAKEKIYNLCK